MHYTLLATDAPDLWMSKIKYILDNDITAMELTFIQVSKETFRRVKFKIKLISGKLCIGGLNSLSFFVGSLFVRRYRTGLPVIKF